MLLGVIADDFTGATDIASMLVKNGMRTVQLIGVPCADFDCPEADAVVVALKSRTTPVANAVSESCEALKWLKAKRARQIYFKYCSTFDSTAEGNIGPVIDALMDAVETDFTVAAPAFPANKRTVFKGYLFAGDVLLSESGMRNHPLTPMTDSNLVRVLQAQTNSKVGLISFETVDAGPAKIKAQIDQLRASGIAIAIVDAIDDMSLLKIGEACAGLALVTGGSGLAMGLPENFRRSGQLSVTSTAAEQNTANGYRAVISGSCSQATNIQVAAMAEKWPVFIVDPLAIAAGQDVAREAIDWAKRHLPHGPVLVSATAPPEKVRLIQQSLGQEKAGQLVEQALAQVSQGLVKAGVRQLIVAGGETSGAVVQALGIQALRIGREISPGVPWTFANTGEGDMALVLKSGNFGGSDFFLSAWDTLS